MIIYIMKIQGTKKIPDYIQVRDENFTLLAYFKMGYPRTALSRCNLLEHMERILDIAAELDYGKIEKLEI